MKKKPQEFKVIIEQDADGFFVASVPALPGCHTQAKTLVELRKRVREVILLCLDVAKHDPQYRSAVRSFSNTPLFMGMEAVSV